MMHQLSINGQPTCDNACPNSYFEDAQTYQNYGCLPSYWEVQEMLKNGKVWMCHSNPTVVCSAVGDRNAVGEKIKEF